MHKHCTELMMKKQIEKFTSNKTVSHTLFYTYTFHFLYNLFHSNSKPTPILPPAILYLLHFPCHFRDLYTFFLNRQLIFIEAKIVVDVIHTRDVCTTMCFTRLYEL